MSSARADATAAAAAARRHAVPSNTITRVSTQKQSLAVDAYFIAALNKMKIASIIATTSCAGSTQRSSAYRGLHKTRNRARSLSLAP